MTKHWPNNIYNKMRDNTLRKNFGCQNIILVILKHEGTPEYFCIEKVQFRNQVFRISGLLCNINYAQSRQVFFNKNVYPSPCAISLQSISRSSCFMVAHCPTVSGFYYWQKTFFFRLHSLHWVFMLILRLAILLVCNSAVTALPP